MADPKETQALIEELRASREQGAATLAILAGLVESLKPRPEVSISEAMEGRLEQLRGKATLKVVKMWDNCTSPDTGATFDVETQDGIVITLRNYKEPEAAYKHKSQGGMWDGEMFVKGELDRTGQPKQTDRFKQWRWETFYKADLARFVGKLCPKYLSETSKPTEAAPPAKTG